MSSNDYLLGIINKYSVNTANAQNKANTIYPIVEKWGGNYIVKSFFSGSLSKGTAVSLGTDADIFISLSSSTPENLQKIYETLYTAFRHAGYSPRKQNVSIGIDVSGHKIDLVPGKRQDQYGNDHSIFRNKLSSWTKTNVNTHISYVKNSGRINEIKLAKIWKQLRKIDLSSFYLEMVVIEALKGFRSDNIETNFLKVLDFIKDELPYKRYVDPANSNNIISDELTNAEKKIISNKASESRSKSYWKDIVW